MDAQSTKLVLIALLRAVSRMKGVLEEPDRAVLKDMVVDEPLSPALLRIGIRMAILDNDPRSGSPEDDQVHLAKRRDLLKEMWDLCKGSTGESSDGEYEDDYESEDDDDMMMPDEDAVRDDQADSTAERDGEERAWTWTVVRVGDLRGNGPTSVTYGDAMLTLVDNAFDVRMQDIVMEEGDRFEGFAKRLSVAVVMNRMLTTNSFATRNKIYSLVSDGPVDRERRKGWDVAKGRSPPPIEDKVVDEELAPKEEEEAETQGAPVPEPA